MSGKYLDLDGSTEYASKSSPVNLDLNGSEMVPAAADRDFEVEGYNWAGAGNHSITGRSTEDKKAGSYSLKFTTSGAGDASTNHLRLPYSYFTALVSGKKYTIEMWVRGVGILGSELIVNGDFTSSTGWDYNGGVWSIGSGVATKIAGSTGFMHRPIPAVTIGDEFEFTFTIVTITGGGVQAALGAANYSISATTAGTHTFRIKATTTTAYAGVYGNSAFAGTIDDVSVRKITRPSLTAVIGSKTKTITNISCVPGTFTKLVFNLKATANEVNQDLKIYCNQADTLYMDSVSVTQAYDLVIQLWHKDNSINLAKSLIRFNSSGLIFGRWTNNKYSLGYGGNTDELQNVPINTWTHVAAIIDKVQGIGISLNGGSKNNISSANLLFTERFSVVDVGVGRVTSAWGNYLGSIGEVQIIRFDAIEDSDFSPSNAYTNGIPSSYTGGGAQVVAHYKWAGDNMTEVLYDHSGNGNNLTGTNLDMTDVGTTPDYPSHYKESLAGTVKCSGHDSAELKSKILLQGSVKCSASAAGGLRSFESLQGLVECSGHDAAELKNKVKLQGEVRASSQVHIAVRRKSEFDLLHLKITEET